MQYLKERYEITTLKKCYAEGVNSSKNLRVAITFDGELREKKFN